MKRFGLVLYWSLAAVSVVTLAAQQRIFTNPRPEPYFKALFPSAVVFSTFGGTPLHYTAFGVDPKTNPSAPPIGYIIWTTDAEPLVPHFLASRFDATCVRPSLFADGCEAALGTPTLPSLSS